MFRSTNINLFSVTCKFKIHRQFLLHERYAKFLFLILVTYTDVNWAHARTNEQKISETIWGFCVGIDQMIGKMEIPGSFSFHWQVDRYDMLG